MTPILGIIASQFEATVQPVSGYNFYVDAGNTSSYSGSGTNWADLTGNTTGLTLANSPTFTSGSAGYFTFNGSNQYAYSGNDADFAMGTGDFSVEALWYCTSIYDYENIIGTRPDNGSSSDKWNHGVFKGSSGANKGTISYYTIQSDKNQVTDSYDINTWAHTVGVRSGGQIRMYVNKVDKGAAQFDENFTYDKLSVGGYWNQVGTEPFTGRIAVIRLYKGKALTSTEVTQNYDSLKTRYGLA
jgi:hypothetical protein